MTTSSTDAPRRAVIYARLSKDRHKGRQGEGMSTERQVGDCRELAARLHPPAEVAADAVFTDNDITAYKRGKRARPRPGYNDLLACLRDGQADVVLAWHTDRLHRDNTELEEYISVCGVQPGIPTYTVQGGNLDLSTASGRLVARILGAVAIQEVEHMEERQRATKAATRKVGGRLGGARPFGYTNDIATRDNPTGVGLIPEPTEADAIEKAAADVIAEGKAASTNAIAARWNRAGLRTPVKRAEPNESGNRRGCGGVPWTASTVKYVLTRALNAGLVEHNGKIIGKGTWEAILDEDTWRTVRALLTDPARRTSPGPEPRYLLTGLLICGVCGSMRFGVTGGGKHERHQRYYSCRAYGNRPGIASNAAGHPSRRQDYLDDYISSVIIDRLSRDDARAALNAHPGLDLPALEGRREAINSELDELARAPGITLSQLQIRNEPLIAELAEVEQKISEAMRGDPLPEFAGVNGAAKAAEVWDLLPIERQRAIAAMLLRVRLHPAGNTRPPGWKIGDPIPFDEASVEILPPDATPEPEAEAAAAVAAARAAFAERDARLAEVIRANPAISDNAAAQAVGDGASHKTAGGVRRRLEKAGQVPVMPRRGHRDAARRAKVADLLRADPTVSDMAAAAGAGVDKLTAGRVRRELETAGQIAVVRRRGRAAPVTVTETSRQEAGG